MPRVLILLLLLAGPAQAQNLVIAPVDPALLEQVEPARRTFKHPAKIRWGLVCSATADAYDAVTTAWILGREDARTQLGYRALLGEGNPLMQFMTRTPGRIIAVKSAASVGYNFASLRVARDKPVAGAIMLFANCAAKAFIGARNERLLRRVQGR